MHDIALFVGNTIDRDHLWARDARFLEFPAVVSKALRIGVPGCGREQAFATKKLEQGTVRQAQYFVAVKVVFDDFGVGTQLLEGIDG